MCKAFKVCRLHSIPSLEDPTEIEREVLLEVLKGVRSNFGLQEELTDKELNRISREYLFLPIPEDEKGGGNRDKVN